MASPRGIHYVGSIPLDTTDEVFRKLCSTAPHHIERLPDGETGPRYYFVRGQVSKFPPSIVKPFTLPNPPTERPTLEELPSLLKDLETGYDNAAISSYQTFRTLRDEGVIPRGTKLQVGLPTPMNGIMVVDERYQLATEPYYEAAIFRALRNIQDTIPHEDLCIQWDCPTEFAMLERAFKDPEQMRFGPWFDPIEEGVIERLVRCVKGRVDEDVDLGFHLCYGDSGHKHFIEPKDVGMMVWLLKQISGKIERRIDWVHMPVPKAREDVEYLMQLRGLREMFGGSTKLYLGLVHANDEEGTKRRIRAAKEVLKDTGISWGVATECGMGRTPREELDSILEISAKAVSPAQ